ncbi:MAG TPA: hypothetical protein PKZ58_07890, partial [Bacillota bacterium]|nr:hypothetical protein [Bacillota bacterium]
MAYIDRILSSSECSPCCLYCSFAVVRRFFLSALFFRGALVIYKTSIMVLLFNTVMEVYTIFGIVCNIRIQGNSKNLQYRKDF